MGEPNKEEQQEELQLTPTEQKAMDNGWVPQEEWDGEADDWVTAAEFNRRGELMGKIHTQKLEINKTATEIAELKKALKALGEHNKKIAERAYADAIRDLKQKKAEALSEDDHNLVVEIDDQIDELKDAKKAADKVVEQETNSQQEEGLDDPVAVAWIENNPWYNTDFEMRGTADGVARAYLAKNPEHTGNSVKVLAHVDKIMKERYPEKFGTRRRPNGANESEEPTGRNRSTGRASSNKLNQEQRKIGQRLVDAGALDSLDEYAKQLDKLGELG